ncbi:DUF5709 domain-containing protein [Microbispora bryophytorum]|uniref:DUF5709 domain-containing protein n=1 Tax=Microbispora bryophytorum subsp. camponoti TaxID=1677852 RepID=A0ABR8L675_9ACTN|nr:DUF5709 domain-containing protein [Microbispora camponoti]MBD3146422.1 hypothetical protein [Microbispora camponoti]
MRQNRPQPDPRSRFEDEGFPDLQEGTPEQQWAEDPQEMPLPGDRPLGLDEYGTTPNEMREGESIGGRLSREVPDVDVRFGTEPGTADGRREEKAGEADDELLDSSEDEQAYSSGAEADVLGESGGRPAESYGAGTGDEAGGYGSGDPADYATVNPAQPGRYGTAEPGQAGRLVDPDGGMGVDTEKDMIAEDVGPDLGGYTAEEQAMRVEDETPI